MRKAVIINVSKRGWDAMIDIPLLPSIDPNELRELLQKVKQVDQPNTWTKEEALRLRYFRVDWYGESGEFVSIQPLLLASDNRFYAIPNVYIIVNVKDGYIADRGFWHPSIVDTLLDALMPSNNNVIYV